MLAQHLHHLVAQGGGHLQHHAQLFVEQGLEGELFAARAHLRGPVLGVAVLGAAVGDAVALGDEHVDVERHADVAGEGHLAGGGEQPPVATVVQCQDVALGAQGVDRAHQVHQVLGMVEVGHAVGDRAAALAERLRQHAAGHAMAAAAEVDQHQRGVGLVAVELRREGAAHVGQRGEGGDDQADR